MKIFEFIFGLIMMQPILQMILKVSKLLQANSLELLTAVDVLNSLKSSLVSMRNNSNHFEDIYQKCLDMCEEFEIHTSDVKRRKVSKKIDISQNQHFFETKSDEMKVTVFNTTLDKLINGIDSKFNQESLQIINSIGNMVKLKTGENVFYKCLKEQFDIYENDLFTEIILLQNMIDIPNSSSVQKIHEWLDWLQDSNKIEIFSNFSKALQLFVTIPVTSFSC